MTIRYRVSSPSQFGSKYLLIDQGIGINNPYKLIPRVYVFNIRQCKFDFW